MVVQTGSGQLLKFQETVNNYGVTIAIVQYTQVIAGAGSWYDDDRTISQSGTTWVSGIHQPIRNKFGSSEARLIEAGKLLTDDKALFIPGTVNISGQAIKIGVGSPTTIYHSVLPDGAETHNIQGVDIYKKVFLRVLPTGSLIGE